MKTQKELIEYYTKNLSKVISTHGGASDYTTYAFFLLQAVKMNVQKSIFIWARNKCSELETETLNLIHF